MTQDSKNEGHAKKAGQQYSDDAETGFEVASRSFDELNKGIQAIAAEMTDYSKRSLEDVFGTWESLLSARSLSDVVQIQTACAKKAYDAYMSEMAKFGRIYLSAAGNAYKLAEKTARNGLT
jgi:hypothetical protein